MTIREYLALDGAYSREVLAKYLGISRGRLSQISDAADIDPVYALAIEALHMGHLVDASDLSSIVKQARAKYHG